MRAEIYDELMLANPDSISPFSLTISKKNVEEESYEDHLIWKHNYISLISSIRGFLAPPTGQIDHEADMKYKDEALFQIKHLINHDAPHLADDVPKHYK